MTFKLISAVSLHARPFRRAVSPSTAPCHSAVSLPPIATQKLCQDTKPCPTRARPYYSAVSRTATARPCALTRLRAWPCVPSYAPNLSSQALCRNTTCCIASMTEKWAIAHPSFSLARFFFHSFFLFHLFYSL